MAFERLRWVRPVALTVLLVALVALATAEQASYLFVVVLAAIAAGVAFFYFAFPGSRFFDIAFANFLAVYACLFAFFRESNFASVAGPAVPVAFLLPIAGFLVGAWLRRTAIRSIVTSERVREERHPGRILAWLVPVSAIGAATFLVPGRGLSAETEGAVLLAAMGLIALVVFAVSREVCIFLLDTGLLFEEFFARAARLFVPAFAFVTFYSLLVIVFAAAYRILDRFSAAHHFAFAGGPAREISFSESLYFSLVTMSTVGYGDISPASDVVRVLAAAQILLGVLLLLFGFSEILGYAREHRGRD